MHATGSGGGRDSAAVARVRVIRSLLTLGLTLEDLRSRAHRLDLLAQEGTPASCAGRPGELSDVVADRLAALDAEIARLTRLRQALAAAAGDVRDAPGQPPPDGQRTGRDPAVPARRSKG